MAILEFNATNVKLIRTAAGLKVRFLTFPGVLKAGNNPRKHHLQHLLMKRLLNQLRCLLMEQLPHQLQHLRIKQPQHLLKTSRHLKRHILHSPPRRDGKCKYRVFIITILLIFFIYLFFAEQNCLQFGHIRLVAKLEAKKPVVSVNIWKNFVCSLQRQYTIGQAML